MKIQYNRNRSYDYTIDRWLQRDPLGVNPAGGEENLFFILGQYKDGLSLYRYLRNSPLIKSFELTIELFQATKKLHGIYAWGHGSIDGFVTYEKYNGKSAYHSFYSNWAPKYKMALGIIWACYSGNGGASPYFSSNGIFRGHAGKLIPLPFHAYGPRVKSIVPPGAQGTKK